MILMMIFARLGPMVSSHVLIQGDSWCLWESGNRISNGWYQSGEASTRGVR